PGLCNESGGLKRVDRGFVDHLARGEPAQFLVDEWEQFIGRVRVAVFDGLEDLGDVAHGILSPALASRSRRVRASRINTCALIWSFHCAPSCRATLAAPIPRPLVSVSRAWSAWRSWCWAIASTI